MLWPLKKRSSNSSWIGLDASPDGICAASVLLPEAIGQGKPRVLRCATVPEAEFGEGALAQLAKKVAVSNFRWTLLLARSDYKLIVLPEPSVKPAEMAESVRWSLGPMLDYPVEEAALDWMPIPTAQYAPQRQQHVYAIVARNEVVSKQAELFRRARLPLSAVDVRETAQRNIAALVERPGEALGMVSVGTQGVEITFTFNGELYLDRFIELPLAVVVNGDESSRARIFERINVQVQRSIDFIRRSLPFMEISRIVIAPLPAPIPLRESLAENIAEPVEILDLASVFDVSATPELAHEENQSRYFTALGGALRGMGALQ